MKLYKKRWVQSGVVLISSLAIVLSVFPSFADEDISSLEGQSTNLQSELEGINEEILSLSEEISTAEMQIEIMNGEIERTSDALAEAEENENQHDGQGAQGGPCHQQAVVGAVLRLQGRDPQGNAQVGTRGEHHQLHGV